MDRDEFMELVYETFADEPDNVLANGIIEAADAYVEHEKAQLSNEDATKDATSELIERQQAIDRFNVIRPVDPKKDEYTKGIDVGIAMCIVAVKDQPTMQPEPQWIPVSERLPEKSEYYIITASDGVGHRTTFAKFQKKAKSWELTGARSYWKVIAWMPLPEPARLENV